MLPEILLEDLSAALDAVAADILEQAAVDGPPVDALQVAQRLGLTVAWDDRQPGRARLVQLCGAGGDQALSILLRPDPRLEREHWAVAHEIGEATAHQVFAKLSVDPREAPPRARETVANGLASRLLLPRDWLAADAAICNWDLIAIKDRYATASHELIARRMLDFQPPVIVTVYDQNRLTWRKGNTPWRLPQPCPLEIACRRQAHESAMAVYDDGPPAVRAWPIHEPTWQREIVRVDIDIFSED